MHIHMFIMCVFYMPENIHFNKNTRFVILLKRKYFVPFNDLEINNNNKKNIKKTKNTHIKR